MQQLKLLSLEELEGQRRLWAYKADTAAGEVATLEQGLAQAALNGESANHRERLANARAEANEALLVVREIDRQLPTAQAANYRRQAKEKRKEAARLEAELAELTAQVTALNEQIKALEGHYYNKPAAGYSGDQVTKSTFLLRKIDALIYRAEGFEFKAAQLESPVKRKVVDEWPA